MAGAKDIIDTFIAAQVAGKALELANGVKAFAPTGDQLMHIGLMPNIPDELIFGRIKGQVQRQGQLDCPQVRGQGPPRTEMVSIISRRISAANCSNCGRVSFFN